MTRCTTCPYCGVGCGLQATPQPNGGVALSADAHHPANRGRLCVKGAVLGDTLGHEGRLLSPQVDGAPADWGGALDSVADRLSAIIRRHGPHAVAFYASGQLLTEDYYAANKVMKGFIGSGNIDTNSRLCMASAVVGYKRAFGADAVPCCYEDLEQTQLAIVAGSNAAWAYPVAWQRLLAARQARPATKIVVIDPRRTASCDDADLHLPLRPGTDAALFAGLLHWLHQQGGLDPRLWPQLNGLEATLAAAAAWTLPAVAQFCRLAEADILAFYRLFADSDRALTLYCMGINQSTSGSDKCNAIINLHLASGKIGRPGCGPFSLTGQPNAMGGREVGGLANQLACHMDFSEENVDRLRRFWHSERVAAEPGLKAVALFEAIARGEVKAVWIMGTNPAVSLPDGLRVRQALAGCELVVVSDVSAKTDTTELAHILLPAQAWGEKDDTVTNAERRISRQRRFLPPAGEARPDWWIISQVAQRMGFASAFAWHHPAAVFREHAALSGFENQGQRAFDISGLATVTDDEWDRLTLVQWPVNARHPQGRARLFDSGRCYHPDGKARLIPIQPRLPVAKPAALWPLLLNTGRTRDQWHTITRTGLVSRLMQHQSEPWCDIHPLDAARFGLEDGCLARIQSAQGWVVVRCRLTSRQQPGCLFVPMHWNQQFCNMANVNQLVAPHTCPFAGQPESKQTAVRIQRYDCDWQGLVLARQPLTLGDDVWWSRVPYGAVTAYWLAGSGAAGDWFAALAGGVISRRKRRRCYTASAGATGRCKSPFTPRAARSRSSISRR